MSKQMPIRISALVVLFLLFASACQAKGGSVQTPAGGATSNPGIAPVDLPAARNDEAGDVDSHKNARQKAAAGGDVFVSGLYERPFNSNTMDKYFPYLDIVDTRGFKDDTWGYATISLANAGPDGGFPGQYAVELDLNKDGRGDWLIRASSVTSTDWTITAVQAWKDSDGDIGSAVPMVADKNPQGGDGYETLVFDEGKGSLKDGAWARIKPDDPKTVEIAFQLSMLGNPASYAMGAFAGTSIDPASFDFNDHMTHAQAGSPLTGYQVYPLKALAEMDNTCRLAIGFAASAAVPGLCATAQQQAEGGGCVPRNCPPTIAGCVPVTCP
jgi:hypothetical protein